MDFRRDYDVDILIRGYNNLDLTKKCIESIKHNTEQPSYQITYVDNGSEPSDWFYRIVDDYDVQCVLLSFNHGSVRAINLGLAMALFSTSKYILLLDNDTEIPKGDVGWLQRFISYFEQDEKIGAVGAVTDYVSGFQHVDKSLDIFQKSWKDDNGQGLDEPPEMPILVSFAMMLRKSAVQEVGFFDETFEPGNCEDYDYTLRLREAGYKCQVANSVWVHHHGSQTFQQFNFKELLQTNMEKLIIKWGVSKLETMGLKVQ